MFKLVFYFLILLSLSACISTPGGNSWPADIPPQQLFIDYCQNNSDSCSTQSKTEKHLIWIKRFYYGSILYPTGWNEMTDIVVDTLDESIDKTSVRERLYQLGLAIALEWSQDNDKRLINSKMLATWADALSISAENFQQIEFITQIEKDVENILSGSLDPADINSKRYNLVEDYDNF